MAPSASVSVSKSASNLAHMASGEGDAGHQHPHHDVDEIQELHASGRISRTPSRSSRNHRPSYSGTNDYHNGLSSTDMVLLDVTSQAQSSGATAGARAPSDSSSNSACCGCCLDRWCHWSRLTTVDMLTSGFVSPSILLGFRVVVAGWLCAVAVAVGILQRTPGDTGVYIFQTLSYLHFCGVALYFVFMVVLTYQNRMLYRQCVSYSLSLVRGVDYPLSSTSCFVWVCYELWAVCTIIVTLIYWSMLYKGDFTWDTFHLHAIQTICMVTESILNRLIFVPFHVVFLLIFGAVYLVFAIIVRYAQGPWIYGFLDYNAHPVSAPLMYPGVLLLVVVVFFVYLYLVKARNHLIQQHRTRTKQQSELHTHLTASKRPQFYTGVSSSSLFEPLPDPDSAQDPSRRASDRGFSSSQAPPASVELGVLSCLRSKHSTPAAALTAPAEAHIS